MFPLPRLTCSFPSLCCAFQGPQEPALQAELQGAVLTSGTHCCMGVPCQGDTDLSLILRRALNHLGFHLIQPPDFPCKCLLFSFPTHICGQSGQCPLGHLLISAVITAGEGQEWLRDRSVGEGPNPASALLFSAQCWLRDTGKPLPSALPAPWHRFCPSCSTQASWSLASHHRLAPCPSLSMFLPSVPRHVLDPGR